MIEGIPPCEGQGPELAVTYVPCCHIKHGPWLILVNGKKVYTVAHGNGGSLVITTPSFMATAITTLPIITAILNSDRSDVTAASDCSWSAVHQTSASFDAWVSEVTTIWMNQAALGEAISNENGDGVVKAIAAGADLNRKLPGGDLPMVRAAKLGMIGIISTLRLHPIADAQWEQAEAAATKADIKAMIARRHDPVPKPLGTD